jgi:hypothetical protein
MSPAMEVDVQDVVDDSEGMPASDPVSDLLVVWW